MHDSTFRRLWVLALATALVAWSIVSPRLPTTWRVPLQAGVGGLLVLATRAPLGLRPPRLWAGLRLGSAVGVAAAIAVATTTSAPTVRLAMSRRELSPSAATWVLLRIPVGTVWSEEAAFRAALATAGSDAFGNSRGRLLQAAAFGLSHIADARAAGEPLVATVLVTGVAGWVFGWLADRSGSVAAPILVHLAINESAAAAALTVQRRYLADGGHTG